MFTRKPTELSAEIGFKSSRSRRISTAEPSNVHLVKLIHGCFLTIRVTHKPRKSGTIFKVSNQEITVRISAYLVQKPSCENIISEDNKPFTIRNGTGMRVVADGACTERMSFL